MGAYKGCAVYQACTAGLQSISEVCAVCNEAQVECKEKLFRASITLKSFG